MRCIVGELSFGMYNVRVNLIHIELRSVKRKEEEEERRTKSKFSRSFFSTVVWASRTLEALFTIE